MEANAGCQQEYHAVRQHNVGKWSFNPLSGLICSMCLPLLKYNNAINETIRKVSLLVS